jgi:asparagine synthase (glutamine-hydrolysing)
MVLTGDGGDEALSGYNVYQSEKFAGQFRGLFRVLGQCPDRLLARASNLARGKARSAINKLHNMSTALQLGFEQRLLAKASWAEAAVVDALLGQRAYGMIGAEEFLSDLLGKCPYRDNFYRLMYYHFKLTLPEDMLTKVDRMSMAHSLEARLPFLDYRLVEFMANVHKDVKLRGYQRKSVLRGTIGRDLPSAVRRASKKGFVVPLREWFFERSVTDGVRRRVGHSPLDLNLNIVDRVVREHQSAQVDYGNFLWMLLVLSEWYRA